MKNSLKIALFLIIGIVANASAQVNINNVLNSANSILGGGLSNDKIVKGLKEALTVGSKNSTEKASKTDGFYKNPLMI